jgi:general nucleoside transport system permease protein
VSVVAAPVGLASEPAVSLSVRISQHPVVRFVAALLIAFSIFGMILLLLGRNPLAAYQAIFQASLGDSYGWTEVLVKVVPFILCALAAAIPAQVGLVNVGAEGQFQIGALTATIVAISFSALPLPLLLPMVLLAGCLGGALWAGIAGFLRAGPGLNEAISTLLLNYVALRVVDSFAHGPLKDPASFNWPFSPPFPDAARLPTFGDSRAHLGLLVALIGVGLFAWLINRTRWGYQMRVVGGNSEAARRGGLPLNRFLVVGMLLGGAAAGLAGMIEASTINGRLQPGIGIGFGYIGFLASWLAGGRPLAIVPMAALLAIIAVGGEVLQIAVRVPSSSVNVLMALILFAVLATRLRAGGGVRA